MYNFVFCRNKQLKIMDKGNIKVKPSPVMDKVTQVLSLVACFFMIAAASVMRDGKVLGHELVGQSLEESVQMEQNDTVRVESDGTLVVNTSGLCRDVVGYAGNVPLEVKIKDGRIVNVVALENNETPDFFEAASAILDSWNGKALSEASSFEVDVVSGATFSSKAIISNVRSAVNYVEQNEKEESLFADFDSSPKAIIGLFVVLLAAVVPLFVKNKTYRLVQLILNVLVLGFWCGTFLSYTSFLAYCSNGMNVVMLVVPLVMLITAFVYPLFGKKSYYCTNVCPFGSMQELTGRCVSYKVKISPATIKRLDTFRQYLWAALMLCLWTGVWFGWIDYEPFSAFIVQSASWIVIAVAVSFIVLSAVVNRPYCRFVCPTGTLLKLSQSNK
jgi:uncharacterized protein with FMN-binding domain